MPNNGKIRIGAVILAAGLSTRMGEQKMLLPWKRKTVIETVVDTLIESGIDEIVVVTGRDAEKVSALLKSKPLTTVFNHSYANGNMVTSLVTGLKMLQGKVDVALMVLGDQPQMQQSTVKQITEEGKQNLASLIIPSYQMRRGHPWLIPARLWDGLFCLKPEQTMRDFIQMNVNEIHYLLVDTPTILADLDTPVDYTNQKPK